MHTVRNVQAGNKFFKRLYVGIFLWFTGRAVQATARVDRQVREEFEKLPPGFTFALGAYPGGPWMVVGKDDGVVRYLGSNPDQRHLHLRLAFKSVDAAFLVLSFQESTTLATARNRLITDGEIPCALSVIRVLDRVETYLLPGFIARLAVKRYPADWSPWRMFFGRVCVYTRTMLGI